MDGVVCPCLFESLLNIFSLFESSALQSVFPTDSFFSTSDFSIEKS